MGLTIRWTIGDVSSRGFEALALSIAGARKLFGPSARYAVGVNTIPLAEARARTGAMAREVEWLAANGIPGWLGPHVDANMAEGVAWKFAAIGLFSEDHVLALDNDVIFWRMPSAVGEWLGDADSLLIAEDVRSCYGQFAGLCPDAPRNSGIVGLPPHFPLAASLQALLAATDARLSVETDEQGLQVALVTSKKHRVVSVEEVSICGYYRPHRLDVGSCGAHFVGVNAKDSWQSSRIWDWKKPQLQQLLNPESACPAAEGALQ